YLISRGLRHACSRCRCGKGSSETTLRQQGTQPKARPPPQACSRRRSGWSTRQDPVLEVGDAGGLDGPDLLESHIRVPEIVEEARTATKQHRNDVQLELVQQSRGQVLLSDVAAAPQHDVLAAGGVVCLLERGLDSVGDEME